MSAQNADAEVIAASLADGDRFVVVFDRHFAAVHHYLARRVGVDLADDLAAETFEQAFKCRARFVPASPGGALPWLLGIAGNRLRGHRRAERRHLRALARVPRTAAPAGWADGVSAVGETPALVRALNGLSAGEREVLLLYALAELSYAEIAVALGIAEGTVRSRLFRARRRLESTLSINDPAPRNPAREESHA